MLQIHPNARTTPVTRAEIANSHERSGVLAQRYGVGVSKTWGYAASWIVCCPKRLSRTAALTCSTRWAP